GNVTLLGLGGGVGGAGKATVIGCSFVGNTASQGAGLEADFGGLTVIDSTFTNNNGNALTSFVTATITDSTFTGNQSNGGAGGAVFHGEGTMDIRNCTFTGNSSIANNLFPLAAGGAITGTAGPSGSLTIRHCTFTANLAKGGDSTDVPFGFGGPAL